MKNISEVHEVTATHLFSNTPQVIFEDWIYPNKLCRWWAPKGWTYSECIVHANKGGAILLVMLAPSGSVHRMKGLFHDIVVPERIVMTTYWLGADELPVLEVLNTVTFKAQGNNTLVKVRAEVLKVKLDGMQYMTHLEKDWKERLERLADWGLRL